MDEKSNDSLKEDIKKKIKDRLKQEILKEIYEELKSEEDSLSEEVMELLKEKSISQHSQSRPIETVKIVEKKRELEEKENLQISTEAILKIASHSLKYANKNIPKEKWVEVIGLLAGYIDEGNNILTIEDAYPMGHGTAIYAEIKDYNNFSRAYEDIRKNNLFICGWYHSHPSYSPFMSSEDVGTQSRYQRLWKKAVALVIDPYEIDGTRLGFKIFRANLKKKKWFEVPFKVKEPLDVKLLPELLEFINPIIDGKPIYLEYDED